MYKVSEKFKEICKSNASTLKYATIHVNEDNIDITESNDLKSFKIEDSCYVNDKFIGTTVAKKINVKILNDGQYNLENKEISVKTGINIDGTIEYVPMGSYLIEKPTTKEVKANTGFTGYDYMIKFNVVYKNRMIYPCKANVLLKDVCDQAGVECGNLDFINADYMILGNPFTNNEKCKEVLSNLAKLAGGFAHIGRDDKLYIKTLKSTGSLLRVKDVHFMTVKELNILPVNRLLGILDSSDEQLDGNNYFEFSKNNKFGEVNSLILRLSGTEGENTVLQDNESIKENGLTELVIEDNAFLINQEEREKVIPKIWSAVKGLEYLPFESKYYGYPYLEVGDMLCIKDGKDKEFVTYVFSHTFEYAGSYDGILKTEALTKTQTTYKNTNDIKTKFKRTERVIDKINGEIEDIIEEQTDFSNKLSNTTQNIDGIIEQVHRLYDFYKETEGTNEIILEDCLPTNIVELKIKPNEVEDILYPQTTLYPSNDIYPHKAGDGATVVFGARTRLVSKEMIYPSEEQYPSNDLIPVGDSSTKKFQFYFGEPLRVFNGISDEFQIIFNEETGICEAKVIRRIDYNDGIYTIYDTSKEENISELTMELFKGINYVYLEEYTDWRIYAKYIFNNELNKEFAPRVESRSEVRKTADEINLEVSKKVNQDEVIASINLSPEQIKILAKNLQLEGFTSINGNFTIDEKGNMTCNDAKINGAVIANGEKFSIDEEGNMTCKSATMENVVCENFTIKNSTIQEGYIELKSTAGNSSFSVTDTSTDRLNSELSASLLNFNSNSDRNVAQVGVDMASGNGFVSVTRNMRMWKFSSNLTKRKEKIH